MRIEKPGFVLSDRYDVEFNNWFDEHVEPVNEAIRNGVEVYASNEVLDDETWHKNMFNDLRTHKALLINIQPIEKDSAEKVLRDMIAIKKQHPVLSYDKQLDTFFERAKKLLAKGEE